MWHITPHSQKLYICSRTTEHEKNRKTIIAKLQLTGNIFEVKPAQYLAAQEVMS